MNVRLVDYTAIYSGEIHVIVQSVLFLSTINTLKPFQIERENYKLCMACGVWWI